MLINACFEGGGIKGLAYVGALRFLEERGFKFGKVSGTSVGALFAALIATGYNSYEIEKEISKIDFRLVANKNKVIDGIKQKGIYSINDLENKLEELFKKKGKTKFQDLKFGDDYLLKIIVTEMKSKSMVVIPDDLNKFGIDKDSFPISKAVAMSCSIPLVFNQYRYKNLVFVDGGVTNNFPLQYAIQENRDTIGFRLSKNQNQLLSKISEKIFNVKKMNVNVGIVDLSCEYIKSSQFKKGFLLKRDLYALGYLKMKSYYYENYIQ